MRNNDKQSLNKIDIDKIFEELANDNMDLFDDKETFDDMDFIGDTESVDDIKALDDMELFDDTTTDNQEISEYDAEQNHLLRYKLEQKLIPELVQKYSEKKITLEFLSDSAVMELYFFDNLSDTYDFAKITNITQNIGYSIETISDDCRLFLYSFPEPTDVPEAKYGAILIQKSEEPIYYTLEMSYSNWALCAPTTKLHRLCNFVDKCDTIQDFATLIKERHQLTGK